MERENKTIACVDVPIELLEKNNAKIYFRKYGRIIRLCLRPKSRTCSIEYNTLTSAQKALLEAGEYNGQIFSVGWDRKSPMRKQIKKKDKDPDWNLDADVQAELAVMNNEYPSQYGLRSDSKMDVDPVAEKLKSKRIIKKVWKPEKPKFVGTKSQSSSVALKKSNKPEEQELLMLLKQPAYTSEEKYKVLEARDKLVRLYSDKTTDMSKAKTTIGTCPDMCPEKERVMREYQSQVHMFEQERIGRGMNHILAVKQYSRSSADQEVPLPYELRPIFILQLTMSYLMHNIMNLGDSNEINVAEWYNFLWDRTRSIRKDITQQELCCEGSVELLEQCARFHIHCSAHLVAEDPSVFDQKINTENLTKCLQTLKYMYHDLKLKGTYCKHEAEFRSYVILLNLNDGNFMWDVQRLEESIVKSHEIQFALDVYSSIDKNNYIKFFKLVKATTYLNACLLLRYFVQVRLKAIKTLLKSYARSPYTNFPIEEFVKLLAFEDVESGIDFLEYHGLYLTQERNYVVLDRKAFFMPELPYSVEKTVHVIESKRYCSVGEAVCGRPLPPSLHNNYKPHTSFNLDGTFKLKELLNELHKEKLEYSEENVEVQEDDDVIDSPITDIEAFRGNEARRQENYIQQGKLSSSILTNEQTDFQTIAKEKLPESRTEPSRKIGGFKFPINTSNNSLNQKSTVIKSVFGYEMGPSQNTNIFSLPKTPTAQLPIKQVKSIVKESDTITNIPEANFQFEEEFRRKEMEREAEETRREVARKKKEEEERRRREEEELRKILLEQKAREKQMEIERQKEKLEKERIERETKRKAEMKKLQEIKSTVAQVVKKLVSDVEEKLKEAKLKEIRENLLKAKIKCMFKKWHNKTKQNKRKRKAVDQCPVWIYSKSLDEEAEELYTQTQEDTLKDMKRYKKGESVDIKIYKETIPDKIDFHELAFKILLTYKPKMENRIRTRVYLKINMSLPDTFELSQGLQRIIQPIDCLFEWKTRNNVKSVLEEYRNSFNRIVYYVENQQGIHVLNDTHGLIFISKTINEYFVKRVKEGLKNFNKFTSIPIYLIIEDVKDIETLSFIKTLDSVSKYKIVTVQFSAQNFKTAIENGLVFVASNMSEPPQLEMDTLRSFLIKYLASEPWKRILSFAKWNGAYKSCLMKPKTVVKLYNEALEHLKTILLDENFQFYHNFPDVFDECLESEIPDCLPCDYKYFPRFWNTISYRALIEKLLHSLKLPNYTTKWPKDGKELEQIVYDYCTKIFKDPQTKFYKIMTVILNNVEYDDDFIVNVKKILWTHVIEIIATEKIMETDFSLKNTPFKECIFNECFAIYSTSNLQEYASKPWFYLENPLIKEEIDMENLMYQEPQLKRMKESYMEDDIYDIDVDETLREIEEISSKTQIDLCKHKNEVTNIESLLKDLEESIAISQKISSKFTDTLKNVLSDN